MSLIFPSHETMRLAAEAEKRIQSAATPPRSGQPGTGIAPPRSCQAAPFPTPQAHPSQAAGNSASSVSDAPPLSFDDDGPRIAWAPLAIIAVSFALWAGFWLSVKWAWEVFL